MKESTLEKYLVKEITKLNGLCLNWVAPGTRGAGSNYYYARRKNIFVEMKQERKVA